MSYMRGPCYVWRDDERVHVWADDDTTAGTIPVGRRVGQARALPLR
jgi:hypothetical protein